MGSRVRGDEEDGSFGWYNGIKKNRVSVRQVWKGFLDQNILQNYSFLGSNWQP